MWNKIKRTGVYGVWALLTILTAAITLMSLIRISSDAEWILEYTHCLPLVLLCGSFMLGILIAGLARWILNMQEKYIRIVPAVLIGLFVLGEGIMLRMFYVLPNTDTCVVEDCAMALLKGLIQTIDEHSSYFWFYGNNYLQVLLTKALFSLMYTVGWQDYYAFLNIVNAACLAAFTVLTWMAARQILGPRRACIALLLLVINPVWYCLTFWTYTTTMSLPVMAGIFYLGIRLIRSKSRRCSVLTGLGLGVLTIFGYYLRPTSVFPTIALLVVGICHMKKDRFHVRKLACAGIAFVILAGAAFVCVKSEINASVADTSKNYPVTHWLMIASQGNGALTTEDNLYTSQFENTEEMRAANLAVIKERLQEMGPADFILMMLKKLGTTWSDGSHGFTGRLTQDTLFTGLYPYLAEGKTDAVLLYSQCYHIVLFFMTCLVCFLQIKRKSWDAGLQMAGVVLFGGILFYFFWETKNVYSVPFLSYCCILAADGFSCRFMEMAESRSGQIAQKKTAGRTEGRFRNAVIRMLSRRNRKHLYYTASVLTIFLTLTAGVLQYGNYTSVMRENISYVLRTVTDFPSGTISNCSAKDKTIEQTFYAAAGFDHIELRADAVSVETDASYKVSLLTDAGETLFEQSVTAENIDGGFICLSFDEVEPDGRTGYLIRIEAESPGGQDSISWYYRSLMALDGYDGVLSVNGTEKQGDLFVSVYRVSESPYTTSVRYVGILVVLLLAEAAVFLSNGKKLYGDNCEGTEQLRMEG